MDYYYCCSFTLINYFENYKHFVDFNTLAYFAIKLVKSSFTINFINVMAFVSIVIIIFGYSIYFVMKHFFDSINITEAIIINSYLNLFNPLEENEVKHIDQSFN